MKRTNTTDVANTSNMSFRFKQFFIEDSKCAMKVGTDGVLLGAWAPIHLRLDDLRFTILDVGTGSGLIARMLMQRCPEAIVDAIDIDPEATEQAKENGVRAYCSSLQEWQIVNRKSPNRQLYDLVVSNPPYFRNSLKNPDEGRKTARHTDTLSYEDNIRQSARLLKEGGQLAVILPAEEEEEVRSLAARYSLYCTRITRVYSKASKPARRVLLCFAKLKIEDLRLKVEEDPLILEDEKGGRSLPYQELCKEFYL